MIIGKIPQDYALDTLSLLCALSLNFVLFVLISHYWGVLIFFKFKIIGIRHHRFT